MSARAVCCSHSPLMMVAPVGDEREQRLRAGFARAAERIAAFDPQLIVCFAPDHFNGFFYDVMPPFCIGTHAAGVGDYQSSATILRVPTDLAERVVRAVQADGVDVAISHQMRVDHGIAQSLELLVGALDRYPILPVFVNAAAPPLPPLARVAALGSAIGNALAHEGTRVLFLGSGGLSHDPPIAKFAGADETTRAMLLDSRGISAEAREQRESRVRAAGAAMRAGRWPGKPLNPAWDRRFLADVSAGSPRAALTMTDAEITNDAGGGGHEVRSWIGALAGLHGYGGDYDGETLAYEPMHEWLTAMGVLWAAPQGEAVLHGS